ncbi:MAG: phytanoyl-CoA dioxygenase family protein [Pseudomonadota bacterium]
MDANNPITKARYDIWYERQSGDVNEFIRQISRTAELSDHPHAMRIEKNVPIYDGDRVRACAASHDGRLELTAEWAKIFLSGAGVVAIKNAFNDTEAVDAATAMFKQMIDQEKASGAGAGDHFAKPGANDRVWNALGKHAVADPENFVRYYSNHCLDLASRAWLGDGYQVTAQVNRVNPGGEPQTPHRDYHLGFMPGERAIRFPAHTHALSAALTLQGAIAHVDMPLESGPTLYLPFSQQFAEGYVAYTRPEFQAVFAEHHVQLPLEKGDAVFFNPALMHGSGHNKSADILRLANLIQVSSAMGRPIENVDRAQVCRAIYPHLADAKLHDAQLKALIAASAEGYAYPTNLDTDLPVGGLAPLTQAEILRQALADDVSVDAFAALMVEWESRRQALAFRMHTT